MNFFEFFLTMQDLNYNKQFKESKMIYEKYNNLIPNDTYLQNRFLNEYEIACKNFILKSKPTNIQIVLFNKCNSNCIMCNQTKSNSFFSDKHLREIISDYLQYLDTLLWQGGELFLYDKFTDIIKYISKYQRINQQIITNAQCLNERTIKELVSLPNIKLIISIDGAKKETYEQIRKGSSFNKLTENIKLLNKYKEKYNSNIAMNINFVILRENYKEISDMITFAKKYNFSAITFNECMPTENYNPNFTEKEQAYISRQLQFAIAYATKSDIKITIQYANNKLSKQNNNDILVCKTPFNKLLLDTNNAFAPECTCLDKDFYKKDSNIEQIWNAKLMQNYRKHILEIKTDNAICNSNCRLYKHYRYN